MSIAEPTMVGMRQNTMGIIRSFCALVSTGGGPGPVRSHLPIGVPGTEESGHTRNHSTGSG